MSVSKWAYKPEKCDGDYCPGDCDNCQKKDEVEECLTEGERRTKMKYLILLDKSICQDYVIEASNINDAIYKLYKETEGSMIEIDDVDLFYTCAKEMKSIEGIIKLYNRFATDTIDKIYIVTAEIYNEDEEERK